MFVTAKQLDVGVRESLARFDDAGEGDPAVLLLPGWCASRRTFAALAPCVARRRRVITVDWRGHGDAPRPARAGGYLDLVDDAVDVVAATGAARVVAAASCDASWAAVELRRRLGDMVAGIVMLDCCVLGLPPARRAVLEALADPTRFAVARDAMLDELFTVPRVVTPPSSRRAEYAGLGEDLWRTASTAVLDAYARHDSPLARLATLERPPLVVHLYVQPPDTTYLAEQQQFAAAHPWFAPVHLDAGASPAERTALAAALIEAFASTL